MIVDSTEFMVQFLQVEYVVGSFRQEMFNVQVRSGWFRFVRLGAIEFGKITFKDVSIYITST